MWIASGEDQKHEQVADQVADSYADLMVAGSVRIAVRNWGGSGKGLILVHGLSRTLIDWDVIAPELAKSYRVVAMDVRGHGRSADGPWSWPASVEDVEAVADHFQMFAPAALGHSLGGMIASMWGRKHPEATGVINLDGHGNPRPDQYIGLDPAWVAERRAELDALQRRQLSALSGPLSEAQLVGLGAQQRALAAQFGVPEAMFVEGMQRGLQVLGDGTFLRPDPGGLGAEIYASLDEVNMFDLYREISCPLLLLNAVDPPGGRPAPMGLSWVVELSAAFRRGQTRDLEALAQSQGNVMVKTIEGTHGLLFEQAAAITTATLAFLDGSRARHLP